MPRDRKSADDPAAEPLGAQPVNAGGLPTPNQTASLPPIMADPSWVFAEQPPKDGRPPAPRMSILKRFASLDDRAAKTEAVESQPNALLATQEGRGQARNPEKQGVG